jgi:hypothetical protein
MDNSQLYVVLALIGVLALAIIIYALKSRLTSLDISASAKEGKLKVTAEPPVAGQGDGDAQPSGVEVDRNLNIGRSDIAIDHKKTRVNDNLTIGSQKVRIGTGALQSNQNDKDKD